MRTADGNSKEQGRALSSLLRGIMATVVVLVLWSCGATKQSRSTGKGDNTQMTKKEFISQHGHRTLPNGLEARGAVYVDAAGQELSSGIRMMLVPDEYFELSARPLGLIEVARIMVDAQEGILILDRMHKKALREGRLSYWAQEARERIGLDPSILRSVIQHQPFDLRASGHSVLQSMKMEYDGRKFHFSKEQKGTAIHHYFTPTGDLIESTVSIAGIGDVQIKYGDFVVVTGSEAHRPYPKMIELRVTTPGKKEGTCTLTIELNRVSETKAPVTRSDMTVPDGYTQVKVEELLKALKAL